VKRENKRDPVKTVKNYAFLFKTKAFSMLSHVSQVRHFIKKGKQTSVILVLSAFLILNIFLFNSIAGQLLSTTSLQSHGTIETVGVSAYKESSCVNSMTNIEWGTIVPGGSVTQTVYIRNEGNSALTLSLNTVNWSPANAGNYISVSWNYGGQTIQPNQVVQITLTLSVSSSISGVNDFYFDIMIVGAS
jgi:hypothetical protein